MENVEKETPISANIVLSPISIDLEICPDNTLDVYLATEGSSGTHYVGLSAADVATHVQDLIECMAEAYLDGTGRQLIIPWRRSRLFR